MGTADAAAMGTADAAAMGTADAAAMGTADAAAMSAGRDSCIFAIIAVASTMIAVYFASWAIADIFSLKADRVLLAFELGTYQVGYSINQFLFAIL
jgi:hypothetical protein